MIPSVNFSLYTAFLRVSSLQCLLQSTLCMIPSVKYSLYTAFLRVSSISKVLCMIPSVNYSLCTAFLRVSSIQCLLQSTLYLILLQKYLLFSAFSKVPSIWYPLHKHPLCSAPYANTVSKAKTLKEPCATHTHTHTHTHTQERAHTQTHTDAPSHTYMHAYTASNSSAHTQPNVPVSHTM